MSRRSMIPALTLAFLCLLPFQLCANTAPAVEPPKEGVAIGSAGFNEMLGKQLGAEALKTEVQADGSYTLSNTVQTLQAQVSSQGTTFNSTSKEADKSGSFTLSLAQWGREGALQKAHSASVYEPRFVRGVF